MMTIYSFCFGFLLTVGVLFVTIAIAKRIMMRDEIKLSPEYIAKLNLPKCDYTPEVIELIANSTKLTKEEKDQTIDNMIAAVESTGKVFSKSNYLYLKSKL